MPRIATFVTLSPAPNFAAWLTRERATGFAGADEDDRASVCRARRCRLVARSGDRCGGARPLLRAAAWYFLRARNSRGLPVDAVARFHLGNGARLERIDWLGDTSERAMAQSYGLMVNYLYDLDYIEQNHEAYAQQQTVVAASAVSRLVHAPAREIVPVSG